MLEQPSADCSTPTPESRPAFVDEDADSSAIPDDVPGPANQAEPVLLTRSRFLEDLDSVIAVDDFALLKQMLVALQEKLILGEYDSHDHTSDSHEQNVVPLRVDTLLCEFKQVLQSYTVERAKHYLDRLRDGVAQSKTSEINDINLARWKEYDTIITDSLWVVDRRDTSGAHLGWYWGNFIPQIPHQMMLRYTKRHDWVLDAFVGSGTTLIECRRLGRNGIGIELNEEVAASARELVDRQPNSHDVTTEVITADSRAADVSSALARHNVDKVQMVILHPPYHDIINFSGDDRDLSNAKTKESFLTKFGEVVDNVTPYLEKGRYCVVVIGDKFEKGEWIPLGFYCMSEVLKRGYVLKSVVVKNFDGTRAKRNQEGLWRYRALVGGFYVFKHEYVLLFKKQ